jgi:hypothetical protein
MSTAALIRSQIEQLDAVNEEETDDKSNLKPTDFGVVVFGAKNKAWTFTELEDLANSDILYRNFRTRLKQFMEANHIELPKDEFRVSIIILNFLNSYSNNLNLLNY